MGGDRLGERTVQRGDIGDVDLVPDPALAEVVLDQEGELEGGNRALDGQVGDVNHQLAAAERFQCVAQPGGPVEGVEVEDLAVPQAAVAHARGEVGTGTGAGGDQEPVVTEGLAVVEVDLIVLGSHRADAALDEVDAGWQVSMPRTADALRLVAAEGNEQVAAGSGARRRGRRP
ncbi:Uncharacterised protein [Mycobacteroides abscessus subsp. abscessus]|nr:Uncharacterised protein [Mycobacteroides abscessus subsp. abscessus]